MVSHTAEENLQSSLRDCAKTLYAGLVHAKKTEPDNTWGQAYAQARYLASLPLIDALSLVALLNSHRIPPASSPTVATKAGENARSAIGGI